MLRKAVPWSENRIAIGSRLIAAYNPFVDVHVRDKEVFRSANFERLKAEAAFTAFFSV